MEGWVGFPVSGVTWGIITVSVSYGGPEARVHTYKMLRTMLDILQELNRC